MTKFKKATKKTAKLRLALFGPAGSGKTYTALRLATGLGGPIAVIDTERGSASKYADCFEFDVLELAKTDIPAYIAAFTAAAQAGYPVLIVDSLSHAWQELLTEVDKLARAKYQGNTWSAWSEGTPKQRQLVDAILAFPGHIIVTMRTKTEWTTGLDEKGRTKPTRVGLAPEQGKGIEYEFDLLMEITPDHLATIIKDRTSRYQDRTIDKPGEDLGRELVKWLAEGVPADPVHTASEAVLRKGEEPPAPAPSSDRPGNGSGSRPLPAEKVKAFVRHKAGWQGDSRLMDGPPITDAQKGTVAGLMATVVKREGMTQAEMDNARHAVLSWMLNVEHTGQLTQREASALIDWLKHESGEGWGVSNYAIAEAQSVLTAWLEGQGQARLLEA